MDVTVMEKEVGYLSCQMGQCGCDVGGALALAAAHRRLLAEHAVGLHGFIDASTRLAGLRGALGADTDLSSPHDHITTRCLTKNYNDEI